MPMPAGNFIIIAISLLVVLSGGLWVFFWWRGRYGVWAREREARSREIDSQNVTVIGGDSAGWYGAAGAMGVYAAAKAQGATDVPRGDAGPSADLYHSGGTLSEPGLGEGGNFDSSPSDSSGSDVSGGSDSGGSSDGGGGGGDSGGSGD